MSINDIAWLAGLLEGEAWFGLSSKGAGRKKTLNIWLEMTDKDIVERARDIMAPNRKVYSKPGRKSHYKRQYKLVVTCNRAKGWMMTIYSLLGKRRQARIRELLNSF